MQMLLFGNPKAGTGLMQALPLVGLDLPVKLLVWQDGDAVNVAYAPMSEIATRYDIDATEPVVHAIDANLAVMGLGVDYGHAATADGNVIDVRAPVPGNPPVVQQPDRTPT